MDSGAPRNATMLYASREYRVRHHDHQIPQAQFEARVPGDAQNDDPPVEVPPFEHRLDRVEPFLSSSSPGEARLHQSLSLNPCSTPKLATPNQRPPESGTISEICLHLSGFGKSPERSSSQ